MTATPELELVPAETGQGMKRADLPVIWEDFRAQATKLKATADTLTVTDVSQVAEMKLARATRLTLKNLRVEIETKRKELGEYHLRQTQKINADAKALKELIEPLELRLLDQEQFVERKEAERKEALRVARVEALKPYGADANLFNLAEMSEEVFEVTLAGIKAAHEAKLAAAAKAEGDRIAKEKADAEERERMRLENARLKKEAEEREAEARKEREAAEAERAKLAKQVEDERKAAKLKADAEAKRVAAEQAAVAEKARKEREAVSTHAQLDRRLLMTLGLSPESAELVMAEIERLRAEVAQLRERLNA